MTEMPGHVPPGHRRSSEVRRCPRCGLKVATDHKGRAVCPRCDLELSPDD